MKPASITKVEIGALIDDPTVGSPVLIGGNIARREPVTGRAEDDSDGEPSQQLDDGVVRSHRSKPSRDLLSSQSPRICGNASGVDTLIKERQGGR